MRQSRQASCRGLPPSRPRLVGTESGQTSRVERGNHTRRPRGAHVVRQTLSFRKDPTRPQGRMRLFGAHRNQALRGQHSVLISQH
jgi:hypothetical protein